MYISLMVTYTPPMKRLQIYLDEDLDEALAAESARSGRSKAALIRDAVRERWGGRPQPDALDELVGAYDEEPGDIDAIVYGP